MRRIKELDSIRGLAALAIVFFHLSSYSPKFLGTAVDLFFVLSGYLITNIILTNAESGRFLLSFYMRRGLRIWPIYYLTLLAVVLIHPLLPPCGNLDDLPYYVTFTQEIPRYKPTVEPSFPSAFRHTWSLAIEEQFYLIWPPLLWLLGKKRLPIVAVSLVAVAVAARSLHLSAFILITHLDGLVLGGLLASLLEEQHRWAFHRERYGSPLRALGLGSTAIYIAATICPRLLHAIWPGLAPSVVIYMFRPLFLNLAFFSLVATVVLYAGHPRLRYLRDARLAYLGSISYGLYFYHHVIFEICKYYENYYAIQPNVLFALVKLTASIALAALSWRYVEQPILALKNRFRYDEAATSWRAVPREVDDIRGVPAG